MKKLLFIPTILLIFSLSFFSCSPQDELAESENSKITPSRQADSHPILIDFNSRFFTTSKQEYSKNIGMPVESRGENYKSSVIFWKKAHDNKSIFYREYSNFKYVLLNGKNINDRIRIIHLEVGPMFKNKGVTVLIRGYKDSDYRNEYKHKYKQNKGFALFYKSIKSSQDIYLEDNGWADSISSLVIHVFLHK